MKAKAKKGQVKATAKKAAPAVERDEWGFRKGSKSSQAVRMLASGKTTLKDVRSKFNTLSFGILLAQLTKNGFKVVADKAGLCTVAGSLRK